MNWFKRQSLIVPDKNGSSFKIDMDIESRKAVAFLARQLGEIIVSDSADIKRLFPTAYTDDAEKDAGYQIFAHGELVDARQDSIAVVCATAEAGLVTKSELESWMGVVNDLRLILGTQLDITEDEHKIDPADPNLENRLLYQNLSILVSDIVNTLSNQLGRP